MRASFLLTVVAPSILAIAATWGFPLSATAEDKFGPWGPPVNLGPIVNTPQYDEERPAISRDNLSLYFDSNRPGRGGLDIWVSQRSSVDDPWGMPQNLGPNINTQYNEASPALSPNGHWLFFGSNRPGGCGKIDIWASHRKDRDDDFAWEPPVNLGCILNGASNDDFPTLFVDNEEDAAILYFASDRPGGLGDYDIYASTMNEDDGTFGLGVLVKELNSPFRDTRAAVRRDGLEIFIASNRPDGLKQHLWVSTRNETEEPWSTPVNLGPVVNSAAMDGGPALSRDGTTLYFHSNRNQPGFRGPVDLYVTTRAKLRKHEEDASNSGR